jgi:hypothetical protein
MTVVGTFETSRDVQRKSECAATPTYVQRNRTDQIERNTAASVQQYRLRRAMTTGGN